MMNNVLLNNGSKIPQLGFGTFRIPNDELGTKAILSAIGIGYRFIDTAYNYENEVNIREAIKLSGVAREAFYISTKVGFQDIIDGKVKEKIHESAENLGLEQIDLVLLHWPATNFIQAYKDMIDLQKAGTIKNLGVSNFQIRHLEALEKNNLPIPVVNQIELHPYFQECELKKYCENKGIAIEAWSPLGGRDHNMCDDKTITEIAQQHKRTPAQIILRWHIQQNNIIFPKSMRAERMKENFEVFDFELEKESMRRINKMDKNKRLYWSPNRWD